MKKTKISTEVAFEEVKSYLQKHLKKEFRRGQMPDSKIKEEYIDLIEAVEDGLLVFDNSSKATYTLRDPLYTDKEDAGLQIKEVSVRNRIKAADKAILMDGLNVTKQLGTYSLKIIAYITQLDQKDVREIEKDDYDVLNQLCSVF